MDAPPAASAPKPCCVCDAQGCKHCTKCKSRHYCSKKCQLVDWHEGGHKAQCRQLAAEFQDRLLDELMPAKKVKEEPAIVEDVAPAAGLKAAARLPAGWTQTTAVVKASALNDGKLDWRGTCAICLDVLPLENGTKTFFDCCCKKICTECYVKCRQHDDRCPLCRAPASKSAPEWMRRLQKHVDKGNADAQSHLGDAYLYGIMGLKKSPKRAFQLYELAAAQGCALAQYNLGVHYDCGDGVKINLKTAAQWYRRAAEQGLAGAEFALGQRLYFGKGVAQSYGEAVRWFRLAAAQGHVEALFNLGTCLEKGHGVSQDSDEALRCFKRAAAEGHAGAAEVAQKLEVHIATTRSG